MSLFTNRGSVTRSRLFFHLSCKASVGGLAGNNLLCKLQRCAASVLEFELQDDRADARVQVIRQDIVDFDYGWYWNMAKGADAVGHGMNDQLCNQLTNRVGVARRLESKLVGRNKVQQ